MSLAAKMSEAELQQHVRDTCRQLGLWHYHPHNSIRSERGWPDSTIIGPRSVIFRELKSEHGIVTPEQRDVGRRLKAAGQDWGVWRPSDWLAGRIQLTLSGVAAIQPTLEGVATAG